MTEQTQQPPAAFVAFLNKVFAFAGTLPDNEAEALRCLVRAGLMADEGTLAHAVAGEDDTSGYLEWFNNPGSSDWHLMTSIGYYVNPKTGQIQPPRVPPSSARSRGGR